MRINIEFLGLPMLSRVTGKKKLELETSGHTVKDAIDELIKHYGKKVEEAFYDSEGNFDLMIQITLNGGPLIPANKHHTPLKEGDTLIFMLLLSGG